MPKFLQTTGQGKRPSHLSFHIYHLSYSRRIPCNSYQLFCLSFILFNKYRLSAVERINGNSHTNVNDGTVWSGSSGEDIFIFADNT
jgi:hypothetical protein